MKTNPSGSFTLYLSERLACSCSARVQVFFILKILNMFFITKLSRLLLVCRVICDFSLGLLSRVFQQMCGQLENSQFWYLYSFKGCMNNYLSDWSVINQFSFIAMVSYLLWSSSPSISVGVNIVATWLRLIHSTLVTDSIIFNRRLIDTFR